MNDDRRPSPRIIEVRLIITATADDGEHTPQPWDLIDEGVMIVSVGWDMTTRRCYKVTVAPVRTLCRAPNDMCMIVMYSGWEGDKPVILTRDIIDELPERFKVTRGMTPRVEGCQEAQRCFLRSQ
jgi:hypothetical protein